MTKKDIIEKIRKAKLGHKRWISYAKAIHMGIELDEGAVPVLETDCSFGKWYYGEGQALSELDSFTSIEKPHTTLHDIYMQLFKAREKPVKRGLFTSAKKAEREKQEAIEMLMNRLIQVSEVLLDNLKTLELDLKAMSDSEFLKLV